MTYARSLRRLFGLPLLLAPLAAAFAFGSAPTQAADSVAEFYKGKQMKFIIRSTPGGSYDLYSRLISRHIVRHIPGNPTMVPINMPGGGGLKSVNHVYLNEPRDGTILTMPAVGITMYQALGLFGDRLKADLKEFHWVGNLSTSNPVVATYFKSKVKTLEDAKTTSAFIGTSGAGSISSRLPAVYNNLLGTKFIVLYGYSGNDAIAMEQGEIDGRASNTYASYNATQREWVENNKLNWILQIGLKKEADLPDVPLLRDLAKTDEEQKIFDFFSKVVVNSRAVMTTPGVPKERVAALRKAFMDTINDPEFQSEAKRLNAVVTPMDGASVQKLNDEILATPADLLKKVVAAMEHKKGNIRKFQKKK